jgi:hypothetical protein
MGVQKKTDDRTGWLLLLFRLPRERTSERVEVWRRLKLHGAVALHGSGYLLPWSQENLERFEWLASAIRRFEGEATIASVRRFDAASEGGLERLFLDARERDYQELIEQLQRLAASPGGRGAAGRASRARQRLEQIKSVDFFEHPLRGRAEALLRSVATAGRGEPSSAGGKKLDAARYRNRRWVTRPRPGIDRVASAWLIRRYIDPKARFVFAEKASAARGAVWYDMFDEPTSSKSAKGSEGFGHHGNLCTFETLRASFAIADGRVETLAQIVHDADLGDARYGRGEGIAIERVLQGWRAEGVPDRKLLERGMELIEGLYRGLA